MSRIGELAAKVAADKGRSDDLEAAMASTGEIADQLAGSFTDIGARGKAAQISEVKTQLGQARNTRWLAEGHLEDALRVLQAVMDGQGASGAGAAGGGSSPTASASSSDASGSENGSPSEPEGGHTFITDLDGQPVKVTLIPAEPEHEPRASGKELVDKSQEDEKLGGFRRTARHSARKVEDLQSFSKEVGKGIEALSRLDDTPGSTEAFTLQDCTPQVISYSAPPPPPPSLNIVDTIVHTVTLSIGALEASSRIRRGRKKNNDND
ncbi:hypothetical protein [Glycomyces arizonensis]|uniref:hypothetical protein n=1 Tax=Glycomyces arizonensis TaxID=256035 RepID=UPI00040F7A41|nr:hypothetical protein [Glycomyces arizonensis]